MKVKAWNLIEESTGGSKLPVGGYVIKILDVEDVPSREYLRITYDIAEGEHAGHYSDSFGKQNAWSTSSCGRTRTPRRACSRRS